MFIFSTILLLIARFMTDGAVGIRTTILYAFLKQSLLKKKSLHNCAADAGTSSSPLEQFRNMSLNFSRAWKRQLVTAVGHKVTNDCPCWGHSREKAATTHSFSSRGLVSQQRVGLDSFRRLILPFQNCHGNMVPITQGKGTMEGR